MMHDSVSPPVTQQVIPDHLQAAGRDREGNADHGIADAIAAVDEPRGGGGGSSGVVYPFRHGGAAPGGIDLHAEARIGLQHALVPDRKPVAVLVEVLGGDDEQRLVIGIRVAVVLADAIARRRRGDAAGPLRDGPFGVAGPFPAQWREVCAEPRDLVGGKFGPGGKRQGAAENEGGTKTKRGRFRAVHGVHGVDPQNEYLTEAVTKSRSLSSLPSPARRV